MNISIFGLGYVGCVGAACFASMGHKVTGVDVSANKVDLINSGRPTIIERDIEELCRKGHEAGLLSATTDVEEAVCSTDISFIAFRLRGSHSLWRAFPDPSAKLVHRLIVRNPGE